MSRHKKFYVALAILGTLLPWSFFGMFIHTHGVDLSLFVKGLYANNAAGGFTTDVLLSLLVFWVWSYKDAKEHHVKHWWLVVPAAFTVGLSLAMPLYLAMRAES